MLYLNEFNVDLDKFVGKHVKFVLTSGIVKKGYIRKVDGEFVYYTDESSKKAKKVLKNVVTFMEIMYEVVSGNEIYVSKKQEFVANENKYINVLTDNGKKRIMFEGFHLLHALDDYICGLTSNNKFVIIDYDCILEWEVLPYDWRWMV